MNRYNILLAMVFLLITACGVIDTYYTDVMWAPKTAPIMCGDYPEMRDNARRCNNGFYTGMSAKNVDQRMSQRCEKLDEGNTVCAMEAIDTWYETERRQEFDIIEKKYVTRDVTVTHYYVFMINTYINDKGIIYDCRAENAKYRWDKPESPRPGSIADKLPKN